MSGAPSRYDDEARQDALAAEYALGALRGAARRRLQSLMVQRPALRLRVEHWEELILPFSVRAAGVRAPERVWRAVHRRISPQAQRAGLRRAWWTGFAAASTGAALLVALLLALWPVPALEPTMMAVLRHRGEAAAMLVSWTPQKAAARRVAVQILDHPVMPANTSWQLWAIGPGGAAPVSLGLVTTDWSQLLEIPETAARALPGAARLAVSIEPKGGSPSGRPSVAYDFEGAVQRVGR